MTKTDINSVRKTAKSFLYLDIKETPFSPVIVSHPYFDSAVGMSKGKMVNFLEDGAALKNAQKEYEEYIDRLDAPAILMRINKPYRLVFLSYIFDFLSDEDKGLCMQEAWVLSENPNEDINVGQNAVLHMFKNCRKEYLMNEDDLKAYNDLPEKLKVYRGIHKGGNKKGLSWTTSKQTAKWFSQRFCRKNTKGIVLERTVNKRNILAYFKSRGEEEIIVDMGSI